MTEVVYSVIFNHIFSELEKIDKAVCRRISEKALLHPGIAAVIYNNVSLTYGELEEKSNIIANYLLEQGIHSEDCVGISLKEGLVLPVTVLGILKAGAVYVPLPADSPVYRINSIIRDAGIKWVFTNSVNDFFDSIAGISVVRLDEAFRAIGRQNTDAPEVELNVNQAAYVIYTSGSTGEPKGVEVEHKSIINYLDWYLDDLQTEAGADLPLTSSINFAAGVTQLFSALLMGRTLHIIDREVVKSPSRLLQWYSLNPGFGLYCVPTLWEEVLSYAETLAENNLPAGPDCLMLSGEALHKSLVDRTFRLWPEIKIWNLYGPTEATANVSYFKVTQDSDIYLGRPIRGARLLLLDQDRKPVPQGEEGFIYITSQALARAYKNKPELTGRVFLKNHNVDGYEKYTLYNTGDIGKYNENNELVFLGRKDHQVKIRGYRIELSEIEKHLGLLPGIRQVACDITTNSNGQNEIVAYLVFKNGSLAVNEIRSFLSGYLPPHFIPERYIYLEEMPKLANSKINRNQLKNLLTTIKGRPALSYSAVAAATDEERQVLAICDRVFEYEGLGMEDNLFDIGAQSIKVIWLQSLLNSAFGSNISFRQIWECPTPAGILRELQDNKSVVTQAGGLKKSKTDRKNSSLSFTQSGIWFNEQAHPEQTAYNIVFSISISGNVSVSVIRMAVEELVLNHDSLNSNFRIENRNAIRIVRDEPIAFDHKDVSGESKDGQLVFEARLTDELFNTKINLETAAPARFHLLHSGDHRYKLYVLVHHIVFDGTSINLFSSELASVYNRLIAHQTKLPAVEAFTYADYEQWLKKKYFDGGFEAAKEFWKNKLDGASYYLNFPYDKPRSKFQSFDGGIRQLKIEGETYKKLLEFNRGQKSTSFVTLLSVFKLLVYKYTGEEDILVGVPFANRTAPETFPIIGLFVNTIVYRTLFNGGKTFGELLNDVRQYTFDAIPYQDYPFEKLVEQLNPERSVSYNPVFQFLFAYHEKSPVITTLDMVKFEACEVLNHFCKFDLDVEAHEYEDSIAVSFNYNKSLFLDESINRLLYRFDYLLQTVLADPGITLDKLLPEPRQLTQQKYAGWNDTDCVVKNYAIFQPLERFANDAPDRIAVETSAGLLTYAELNRKANQLAWHLVGLGIGKGDIAGVVTDRSMEMIVALFAILKTGAAYLPIDPSAPAQRIQFMVADSGMKLLLVKDIFADGFTRVELACKTVVFNTPEIYASVQNTNPSVAIGSGDLAYIIYTSGSTGNPKGVMIAHHSVINRLEWMQKAYPIDVTDVVLQKTSYTFDVSVWELFWWSMVGARLHLLEPDGEKNPEVIINTIHDFGITTLHFVPSLLTVFLENIATSANGTERLASLRKVFASGEALEKHHVSQFTKLIATATCAKLINLYGPTEATIDVTHFDCSINVVAGKVPIGKPIDNCAVYILDKHFNVLTDGIPGELCLSGICLAHGYVNNPQLTAEKFFTHPELSLRLYKTGDQARWLPDGNIEYMGRIDSMVKIRGFRIEPGEIENCLNRHGHIAESVVTVKQLSAEDVRLIAYYVLHEGKQDADFNSYLKSYLPQYMIPSAYIKLGELPRLSNGKINHKELPEPFSEQKKVMGTREYVNDYERKLAAIWNDVLKHDGFLLTDNFYDVGGYSLLLISMKHKIDETFGINIKVIDLFQYPTIKQLANVILDRDSENLRSAFNRRSELQRKSFAKLKNS